MIMPCLDLKLAANLEKTFMLDKMEPDHIFLLMVRLMESAFISVYLLALSLWYWLGVGAATQSTHAQGPGWDHLQCIPFIQHLG